MSKDRKLVREKPCRYLGGEHPNQGAASAKALRWENVWHGGGTGRRLVLVEQRSRGGKGSGRDGSESKVRVCRTLGVTVRPLTFTLNESGVMRRF